LIRCLRSGYARGRTDFGRDQRKKWNQAPINRSAMMIHLEFVAP
jgi:hypothetical protein